MRFKLGDSEDQHVWSLMHYVHLVIHRSLQAPVSLFCINAKSRPATVIFYVWYFLYSRQVPSLAIRLSNIVAVFPVPWPDPLDKVSSFFDNATSAHWPSVNYLTRHLNQKRLTAAREQIIPLPKYDHHKAQVYTLKQWYEWCGDILVFVWGIIC
jgi:hypothetical protein